MTDDQPLVSIIVPVHNAERFIAQTIECALDQTWVNKEVIIIDDGSTDNSLAIAQRYISKGVKVFSQPNKGASSARNYGLKVASGSYIQFLDADDLLSADKIEEQLKNINGSRSQLAISRTIHFFDNDSPENGIEETGWYYRDHTDTLDFLTKLYAGEEIMSGHGGMITVHSWLTPRALIDNAGPWNEELNLDDDGEFFCRIVLAADGIKYSQKGFNYYRKFRATRSLSSQKTDRTLKSGMLAIDLKFAHLKARSGARLLDHIFARHYWRMGIMAYPRFKELSKRCIAKAKLLGYKGPEYVGGPNSKFIARLFGWKVARYSLYLMSKT